MFSVKKQCELYECIHFKNNRCAMGLHDKPKTLPPNPYSCRFFSNSTWYTTKHRIKRKRQEGKLKYQPNGKGERDIGKDFTSIDYGKRGKKKNKGI